jgi:capsular exopolysaccharide synthesis family protein
LYEQPGQDQPSVLGAAWDHIVLVAVVAAAFAVAAIIYSISRPPVYEAVASVVFEDPSSSNVLGGGSTGQSTRMVANELAIFRSGAVTVRAHEILVQRGITDLTQSDLRRGAVFTSLLNADVILISFSADDPLVAEAATEAHIQAYQDVRGSQRDIEADRSLDRLDSAEVLLIADLDQVRADLEVARSARSLASKIDATLDALATLEDSLSSTQSPTERESLLQRQGELQAQLQTLRLAFQVESERRDIAALLRRENQILDRLSDLAERRSAIEIEMGTRTSGLAFVSAAAVTQTGSASGRFFTALAGLALGLMVGIGAAYAVSTTRKRFRERMQPSGALGIPFLADVPRFDPVSLRTMLPVRDNARSAAAEAFRFAASSLDFRMERTGAKTVMAVSAVVGDGKSTVLANTAIALARSGKRVLVVDADFGNQSVSRLLLGDIRLGPGLTELVAGKALLAEAAVAVPIGHGALLDVIGRGTEPVSAPSVLSSPDVRAVMTRMTDRYDAVFVDGPPLMQVAYGSILARLVDTTLLVIPHGSSTRKAQELVRQIETIETPAVGYVYNKAPVRDEMMASGGSMKDVIGDAGLIEPLRERG